MNVNLLENIMEYELKDWLNSINLSKVDITEDDPNSIKYYDPYIINRCLSGNLDCILFTNEMNMNSHLDKKLQYDFYLNSLRKRKRFSPWLKKNKIEDLEYVKKYYKYSDEKAYQALKILSKEQLQFIKQKFETGGKK